MVRIPPLNWLKAFEAAARFSSISAGARELNVTTSAVSQHVKRLKSTLGAPLLWREGNRVRLSEAGQVLARRLGQAFAQIEDAIEPLAVPTPGAVTIGASSVFARNWLAPRIDVINRGAGLRARAIRAGETIEEADLAVTLDRLRPRDGAVFLGRDSIFPVCSPGYLADRLSNGTLERPVLVCGSQLGPLWKEWLDLPGAPTAHGAIHTPAPTEEIAIDAARIGLGLSMARDSSIARDLATGALVAPFRAKLRSQEAYWLVIRHDNPIVARVAQKLTDAAPGARKVVGAAV